MKAFISTVLIALIWVSLPAHSVESFHDYVQAVELKNTRYDSIGQVVTGGDIDRKTICLRPMRQGLPNISAEDTGKQLRVNLYGHGGSGWTLLWGSVDRAMELFDQKAKKHRYGKNVPITVIGAGCMGKAIALTLHHAGYRNVQIVAENDSSIASLNSTGYLAMVSLATENAEEDEFAEQLAIDSLKGYQKVDAGTHPIINEGVRLVPVYTGTGKRGDFGPLETHTGIEPFAEAGLLPKPIEGVVEFSTGKQYRMKKFYTYFMDTLVLMKAFDRSLAEKKIPVHHRTVHSLPEIKTPVVFNASGLGARQLNDDGKVYPSLGLLLELQGQPLKELDYIVYTRFQPEGEPLRDSPAGKADIYFMPRSGGLLGGTFLDHYDGSRTQLNEKLFNRILRDNKEFFGY